MAEVWPWQAQVDSVVERIKAKGAQLRASNESTHSAETRAAWLKELLLLKHEVRARARAPPRRACAALG